MILFYQFAVCNASEKTPFNDWEEQHTRQGFSWRPESACFATIDCGLLEIEVKLVDHIPLPTLSRAITVPFFVNANEKVEVATVVESRYFSLKSNTYGLMYEHQKCNDKMVSKLWFCESTEVVPAVFSADPTFAPSLPLLMDARAAT